MAWFKSSCFLDASSRTTYSIGSLIGAWMRRTLRVYRAPRNNIEIKVSHCWPSSAHIGKIPDASIARKRCEQKWLPRWLHYIAISVQLIPLRHCQPALYAAGTICLQHVSRHIGTLTVNNPSIFPVTFGGARSRPLRSGPPQDSRRPCHFGQRRFLSELCWPSFEGFRVLW